MFEKDTETGKALSGLVDVMIMLAKDAEKRKRFLKSPEENQKEIHADLNKHDVKVPNNAFVAFDPGVAYVKVFLSGAKEGQTITLGGQTIALEQPEDVHELSGEGFDKKLLYKPKKEQEPVEIRMDENVKKYDISIILPFMLVGPMVFQFGTERKNEIILSSC